MLISFVKKTWSTVLALLRQKNRKVCGRLLQRNLLPCLAEMRERAGSNINRENNKQSAELAYTTP